MLTTVAKTINICIVKLLTFMTLKYIFFKIILTVYYICKVSGKFPFQFVTYLKHHYHYYVFSKKKKIGFGRHPGVPWPIFAKNI